MTNVTGTERFSLTGPSPWLRAYLVRNFPLRKLCPREPSYVSSFLYTMGVLALAGLIVAVLSGALIALGGVSFWHTNRFGALMNSIHFWSVQLFFLFTAVHFIFNFFIMAWRGGRGWTWITGVLAFILGVLTSFTGFLMMTNWDSQWIAQQAKDAFNALGIGAIWNVMDAGQQFTMHVVVTTAQPEVGSDVRGCPTTRQTGPDSPGASARLHCPILDAEASSGSDVPDTPLASQF